MLSNVVKCKNVFKVYHNAFLQNEYRSFYIFTFTFLQNKDKYIIYR